jgi:hypothetical protein
MRNPPEVWRGVLFPAGLACSICLLLAGCNDVLTNSGAAHPGNRPTESGKVEGPESALRVTFDDLDLFKLLNMDPVTSDCIERMPEALKNLDGKRIQIRGFMKPSPLSEGLPQFLFVRSTDMCCFGPKGKVYHMIEVLLKPPTTTDYIELKPFDVVGTFHIEKIELDPGTVFLLYHLEDAAIIRN